MISTEKLFDAIQLAEASYTLLDGVRDSNSLKDALQDRDLQGTLSASQAQALVGAWSLLNHQPNTTTGFSATLFQRNGNPSELFLAVRGTEFLRSVQEFSRDLARSDLRDIILQGFAINQILDLYNYWQRLVASPNATVRLARTSFTTNPNTPGVFTPNLGANAVPEYARVEFFDSPNAGLGLVQGVSNLTVTGHSLGGHLSTAFSRIFPSIPVEIVTVNGMGTGVSDIANRFFDALAETSNTSFESSRIANMVGSASPNLATGELLYTQFGERAPLYTESAISATLGHGAEQMTDSAAVYDLFVRMDESLQRKKPSEMAEFLLDIFKAASNSAGFTLESVVNMLGKLFVPGFTEIPKDREDDRDLLFQKIVAIRSSLPAGLTVERLVDSDAGKIAELANTGIGYRYALQELNPFAIVGGDSLYERFNRNGELELFNAFGDKGLTDKWLEDRAKFLAAKISINKGDLQKYQNLGEHFEDRAADGSVKYDLGLPATLPNYIFGGDGIDSIEGGFRADHLYGGAGGDTINAGAGADYIEGNDGFDTIDAGSGDDEIHGGDGADTIRGGAGEDVIVGGKGFDTELRGGDDSDRIWGDEQQEGEGAERYAGANYGGNDKLYGEAGDDFLYGGGGDDRLEGGAGKDELYGDGKDANDTERTGVDTLIGGDEDDRLFGGMGKDVLWGDEENGDDAIFGAADTLSGNAGQDELHGGGGNDFLFGGDENDEQKDVLVGGTGSDFLFGGAGNDLLYGDRRDQNDEYDSMGNDSLFGEAGDDELYGGAGKDRLDGGADNDLLRGGKGVADYLVGGAGNDTYIFFSEDGNDIIFDEDGKGHIEFDGTTLSGGASKDVNTFIYYDDYCDPHWIYSAAGDPRRGVVRLTIQSVDTGAKLFVENFDNRRNDLGITLTQGNGEDPDCQIPPKGPPPPPKPPKPPRVADPRPDPLVVDLGRRGFQATFGLTENLHFDLDGDGFAEKVGWAGADDGVLVFDRNGDGRLNDGQELFGDLTKLAGGQLATNGFQALSVYDANRDGKIDAADPIWQSLKVGVWESSAGGVLLLGDPTPSMSLKSMEEVRLQSISLHSIIADSSSPDSNINQLTRVGEAVFDDGDVRVVAEFRFARDNADTRFLDLRAVPAEIEALPNIKPGGVLMPLQQALVRDAQEGYLGKPQGALRAKLDAFVSETDVTKAYARFEDLLFAWTGADTIPAGTATNGLEARHAAVLAKLYGDSFQNPTRSEGALWQTAYENLAEGFYANLMAQTHFRDYYSAVDWQHNDSIAGLFGNLAAPQASLDALLSADAVSGRAAINEFGRTLRGLGFTGNTTYLALREHFTGAGTDRDLAFAFDALGKPLAGAADAVSSGGLRFSAFTQAFHSKSSTFANGDGGNDVLYGDDLPGGESRLIGGAGDNILIAGGGHDNLSGLGGDDLLDGGAGDDRLLGGAGDDMYIFRRGSGHDVIEEVDGTDTVFFGSGLTRDDLILHRTLGGDTIQIAGTDDVLALPALGGSVYAGSQAVTATSTIERFMFEDGTVLSYRDLFAPTDGNDQLFGGPDDDTIDALAGEDMVIGREGNDTLMGDAGDDLLDGGAGNDVLLGGDGDDTLMGGMGDDFFDGGAGDDRLVVGALDDPAQLAWYGYLFQARRASNGNDSFAFGFGDGHDTIDDFDANPGSIDTVAFKAGVTPGDVTLGNDGEDLMLTLPSGERLTVKGHFRLDSFSAVERATFADGTVWDSDTLNTMTKIGTPFNDTLLSSPRARMRLFGLEGDDSLSGGDGDDALLGGDGNDRLLGGAGDDLLQGGAGNDQLIAESGNDTLEGGDGDDLLSGSDGSNVYDGGAGDDSLVEPDSASSGSPGADVFLFGRGDGHDTVSSRRFDTQRWSYRPQGPSVVVDDVVRFKPGVSQDDIALTVTRTLGIRRSSGNFDTSTDVVVTIAGDPDSALSIKAFLGGTFSVDTYSSTVKSFEFADGATWSYDDIVSRLVWSGTDGDDRSFLLSERDDRAFALAGNDQIYAGGGNDTLDAGEGNDFVDGGSGDDFILGGAGDDSLFSASGNDVVDGGAGNDFIGTTLQLGALQFHGINPPVAGDLTVLFGRGDGSDTVQASNGRADSSDTLRLKPGITLDDIALARSSADLLVSIRDTGDSIRLRDWFTPTFSASGQGYAYRIENLAFADGSLLDAEAIRARLLIGGEGSDELRGYDDRDDVILGNGGNDRLFGADGADRLAGGAGDDTLDGGAGDDVYGFGRGDGNDTILTVFVEDAIELDAGIAPDDVRVRNIGGSLRLSLDSGESIFAVDQFAPFLGAVVRFADATVWDQSELRERALAGTPGDDVVEGFDFDQNGSLSNDFLTGGGGVDQLEGGFGDDFYLFQSGYVSISDRGGFDTLSFGGLTLDELSFSLSEGELLVEVTATGESVSIRNFGGEFGLNDTINEFLFDNESIALDDFTVFALAGGAGDAEVLTGTQFDDELMGSDPVTLIFAGAGNDTAFGGGGADQIQGDEGNDALYGDAGSDFLDGGGGDDTIDGGAGDDEMYGGEGRDQMFGGEGDDSLTAGAGDDRMEGGAGRDRIDGEGGRDTIVFGRGDGLDEIIAQAPEVQIRPGFERAYEEAQNELDVLSNWDSDANFYTTEWIGASDGGFAQDLPPDLLERLYEFGRGDGVRPEDARAVLEELQTLLTTPLRPDMEGTNYRRLERFGRLELAAARMLSDDQFYENTFWADQEDREGVPAIIWDPLVALATGNVPKRDAEIALNALLGWLYEANQGEEGELYGVYAEATVEQEEASALTPEDTYVNDYWQGRSFGNEELDARLQALTFGVRPDVAVAALQDLRDWLLHGAQPAVEEDTIEFGSGITPEDLQVATAGGRNGGTVTELAIGAHGTNDGMTISQNGLGNGNSTAVTELSVRSFRFADGTVLTLNEILALADGRIGYQEGTTDAEVLKGSVAEDSIFASDGDDIIVARGGDDEAQGGGGDDLIAGERGNDLLYGGSGSDTLVFNYGDGEDSIEDLFDGEPGDVDTLSFGMDIAPEMVAASMGIDGRLTLVIDGGLGGRISMQWFDVFSGMAPFDPAPVQRLQFVDADGMVRVFDLAGLVASRSSELLAPVAEIGLFGSDAGAFELTGTVIPAGGDRAVAYAQTGNLFGESFYASGNVASGASDILVTTAADDSIEAGAGDDLVSAGGGGDFVDGGDGDDRLDGGSGDDTLVGGEGNDSLAGGAGNDRIFAGSGDNSAAGGDGDDTYYFNAGEGTLAIDDEAFDHGPNRVVFGPGISADSVKLGHEGNTLTLDPGTPGDQIRLTSFDPLDPHGSRAVELFVFDDGSEVSYDELVERGFDLAGTPAGDVLIGGSTTERIQGLEGDDLIAGGMGDDTLSGGTGSDTYLFNLGDGTDVLIDRESLLERNVLEFGDGIDPLSISVALIAGRLELGYGDQGDSILLPDVDPGDPTKGIAFDLMRFTDGSARSLADVIANGIGIYGTPEADRLNGTLGGDSFFGARGDDMLIGGEGDDTYFLFEGDGLDTLEDVSDATQSNTVVFDHPGAGSLDDLVVGFDRDAGTLTLRVSGTDDGVILTGFDPKDVFGAHAVDRFVFNSSGEQSSYADLIGRGFEIEGTGEGDFLQGSSARDFIHGFEGNDVIAGGPGGDVAEGGAGDDIYVFNRGDGVLTVRDAISLSPQNAVQFGPGITLADLHNNLRFIAPDVDSGAPGVLRIGLGGDDEIDIEGFDPDDPENGEHEVENYRFDDGTLISYHELVLNTFIVQGDFGDDVLFGTNTQDRLYGFEGNDELHAGLGGDTLTGGTGDDLLFGEDGADMYVFHAGDGHDTIVDSGANFDGNFISFDPDVDPSTISALQDGDDMVITYGASDSVRILGWNPARPVIGEIRLDNDPVSAFAVGRLRNLAPRAGAAIEDQSVLEDQPLAYTVPGDAFSDPEGGPLTYTATMADGSALPSWLGFNPETLVFFGTPENIDVGTLGVELTATDMFGASVSQTFDVNVLNTSDAPLLVGVLGAHTATQGDPFELVLPEDEFVDIDAGDRLTLSVALASGDPLPAWLSFDASTRTLSGTPANADVGAVHLRVTATDADGLSQTDDIALTVENVNDAPMVAVAIADQSALEDLEFGFTVPAGTFADIDAGDSLVTFATLADGSALPGWLSYHANTATFSGTPANEDVGTLTVTVVAVDRSGAATSDTFDLSVANTNDAPTTADDFATVSEDGILSATGNVLENDTDADTGATLEVTAPRDVTGAYGTLTVSADGAYTYSLNNSSAAVQSLAEGQSVAEVFSYSTSDGTASRSSTLMIGITGANDAPVVSAPLADQTTSTGLVFSFTVSANAFTDVDHGAVLSYSAGLASGAALPAWLNFNAETRTFSGTPGTNDESAFSVRVTAADNLGASAFDDFTLVVDGGGAGQLIVGTDGDDLLTGTPFDDVIDGREGFDRMAGGKGNDIYFVDRARGDDHHDHEHDHGHKVDEVIENASEGYDTVYASTDYTLAPNVEEVRLLGRGDLDATGNALDNVLAGNGGDNTLSGGAGSDTYIYGLHEGSDTIDENGASGQVDTLKLQGMAPGTVRLNRRKDDLVVDFPGRGGKVTVKDWFANSGSRVERFQFDDGTVWDEAQIRSRVGRSVGAVSDPGQTGVYDRGREHGRDDDHGGSYGRGDDRHDRDSRDHDEQKTRNESDEAILRRLKQPAAFSFEQITSALGQPGPSLSAAEIARRWAVVRGYTGEEGDGNGDHVEHALFPSLKDLGLSAASSSGGFGFEGSIGASQGPGELKRFQGLADGFQKL